MATRASTQENSQQMGTGKQEWGSFPFVTTGLTVEVPLQLTKVMAPLGLTWKSNVGPGEKLYCDGVLTDQCVTVTREVDPIYLHNGMDDESLVASNDWVEVPIGISPVAGTMTQCFVYNVTQAADAGANYPLLNLGKVAAYGAGAIDIDWFIKAGDGTSATHGMPTDSAGADYSALIGGASGSAVVAAGDLITLTTTTAEAGTPTGVFCQVTIVPTPTSAAEFWYHFAGY